MNSKLGLGIAAVALVICGLFTMNFGAESTSPEQAAVAAEQKAAELNNRGIQQRLEWEKRQANSLAARPRQNIRLSNVGLN